MKYLSDSLTTSYFDRAEVFAALRAYSPEIILDETDGQQKPPESKPEIQKESDWLKDYSGYASFDISDAALILTGKDPAEIDGDYWRELAMPEDWRARKFLNSRADDLGVSENSYEKIKHEKIREVCAKYGWRWPVPEITPIATSTGSASQEVENLRKQLDALARDKDNIHRELQRVIAEQDKTWRDWRDRMNELIDTQSERDNLRKELEQLRQQHPQPSTQPAAEPDAGDMTTQRYNKHAKAWASLAMAHGVTIHGAELRGLADFHERFPMEHRPSLNWLKVVINDGRRMIPAPPLDAK